MKEATTNAALKLALDLAIMHHSDDGYAELRLKVRQLAKEALAQPEQEPVVWLTEERYAEMHTSKWTPKIRQVFSKDGLLESQTIQYAPQSAPIPYPPKRPWVGLTDEEIEDCMEMSIQKTCRAIEAKLKELNT